MTNRDAIARGMDALQAKGSFTLSTRGRAAPIAKKDPDQLADAEAWNMLAHLKTIA